MSPGFESGLFHLAPSEQTVHNQKNKVTVPSGLLGSLANAQPFMIMS